MGNPAHGGAFLFLEGKGVALRGIAPRAPHAENHFLCYDGQFFRIKLPFLFTLPAKEHVHDCALLLLASSPGTHYEKSQNVFAHHFQK